jgi:hypothetical protein
MATGYSLLLLCKDRISMRKAYLALLIVLLPCLLPRVRHLVPHLRLEDFLVYDTASVLARQHQGAGIYEGADDGSDPQLRYADSRTHFAGVARELGAPETRLYLYPPVLADIIIPLSVLPLRTAGLIWTALNYAGLIALAALLISLLRIPWRSFEAVALAVGLFCALPVIMCIVWGQVTLFLALMWVFGMWLYREGWPRTSAAVFALATTIKLVPLIAILPFVIWKEWRWVRSFVASLLVLTGGMCLVNGPAALSDFVFHILPPMSRGIADVSNETILSSCQLVYILFHGGDLLHGTPAAPRYVILLGKLLSLIVLILASRSLLKLGDKMTVPNRLLALFFLYMLSNPVAPVTWAHGYIATVIGLGVCWVQGFRTGLSNGKLLFLSACTLVVTNFGVHTAINFFVHHHLDVIVVLLSAFTPIAIVILSLTSLEALTTNEPPVGIAEPEAHYREDLRGASYAH